MGDIRVGIGGWSYEPWRGVFYPPDLPQKREFDYAVGRMTAIEINATFYGRQSPKSWQTWGEAVPEGFQFAVKGSRYCVTRSKLGDAGEGVERFLDQGLTALGPKLGPILWLLAARRTFDADDIEAFFALLPRTRDGLTLRHAIEPRHESFRDERFFALARDHNVAVVFGDDDEFPCLDADTADFRYARLQRMREEVETGYEGGALDGWAEQACGWASGGDAYIFMINGAKVRAPAAALGLQARLGLAKAAP